MEQPVARKKASSVDKATLPSDLPVCPFGFEPRVWLNRQMWLLWDQKVPADQVRKIITSRQMNLWVWLLALGHPWKFIADNEAALIAKDFKREPGQA